MSVFKTLKSIYEGLMQHPLTQTLDKRIIVGSRIVSWQLMKHFYKNGKMINWINDRRLMIYPGRASSTACYYYGLPEYESMSFLYQYISSQDIFFDIGANIGVYTILCGNAKKIVVFEPANDTMELLKINCTLNGIDNIIFRKEGVSNKDGMVFFTKDLDSINRVVDSSIMGEDYEKIQIVSLNHFCEKNNLIPDVIKIDVVGEEGKVIEGANNILANDKVNVIIMEICGNLELSELIKNKGFKLYKYDVYSGDLSEEKMLVPGKNQIYIKDLEQARERLRYRKSIKYAGSNLIV